MRAIVFTGAGGNEVARLVERPDPEPGPEDLIVAADYAALNPADLLQRAGAYPAPPGSVADIAGLEVTGTIVGCGERVSTRRVGERVFGLVGGGGLADCVLVHERLVAPVPDALDDRDAAAVPESFITAHDAVVAQGGLRPGETVLVHGAGGGVGGAALQIAVGMGARAIGVVRNDPAREAVREQGALAVDDGTFAADVLEHTGGRGADVILELVGAPHFPGNLDALAPSGRVVVVGVGAGSDIELRLLTLMQKRATIRGTVLRGRPLEEKAVAVRAFEREVLPALARGDMRPRVDAVFPAERFAEAFDHLAAPGKVGKVLLEFC